MSRLIWNGDRVLSRIEAAAVRGINATMDDAVRDAKSNHPGWKNRTGAAERSVKVLQSARKEGNAIVGRWGSDKREAFWVLFLEMFRGAFMRRSADSNHPRLAANIRRRLR